MAPESETTFRPLSLTISAGDFAGIGLHRREHLFPCLPLICPESIKLSSSWHVLGRDRERGRQAMGLGAA